MPASSISRLGAITSPRPASWRWAITTARRDCRGISSRGSRPFGAKASPPGRAVPPIRPAMSRLRAERRAVAPGTTPWRPEAAVRRRRTGIVHECRGRTAAVRGCHRCTICCDGGRPREPDQDWRLDFEPSLQRHLPDGRGGGATAGHPNPPHRHNSQFGAGVEHVVQDGGCLRRPSNAGRKTGTGAVEIALVTPCGPAFRRVSLQLRDAGAGAVFVLLSGAAADAAGALDDAIAYDRNRSLAHDHVAALRRGNPARSWLVGTLRHLAAGAAKCSRSDGLALARIGARPNRAVHALKCDRPAAGIADR